MFTNIYRMSEEDEREMRREGRRRIKVMWSMFLAWVHACKDLVCVLQREFLEAEFQITYSPCTGLEDPPLIKELVDSMGIVTACCARLGMG